MKKEIEKQIIEEFEEKLNEVIAYAVNGQCGGRNLDDCKKDIKFFVFSIIDQILKEKSKEIEKLKNFWTTCNDKNCGNREECERANHYIRTIWNPTFKKILEILKK